MNKVRSILVMATTFAALSASANGFVKANSLCIPHNDNTTSDVVAQRCQNILSMINKLANDNVVIQASCRPANGNDDCQSMWSGAQILETKVMIIPSGAQ